MINVYPVTKAEHKQKSDKSKRTPWSVDPDQELEDMMAKAMEATGKDRSELIRECVRGKLPLIVEKYAADRKKSEEEFASRFGPKGKTEGKGK